MGRVQFEVEKPSELNYIDYIASSAETGCLRFTMDQIDNTPTIRKPINEMVVV